MRYLAIALGALVLGGCAETRASIPSTQEAAQATPECHVAMVRLRTESPDDKMQRAAYATVKRLLVEENYDVLEPTATTYDVDMVLGARTYEDANGKHTTITLSSIAGRRVLAPLSAEFVSTDGTVDEPSLVEVCMSWKRSYMHWMQAVRRHREMIAIDRHSDLRAPESAAKPLVGALDERAGH